MWIVIAALVSGAILFVWAVPRVDQVPSNRWSRFISGLAVVAGLAWLAFYIADVHAGEVVAGVTSFICIWFAIVNTAVGVLREPTVEHAVGHRMTAVDLGLKRRAILVVVLAVSGVLAAVAAVVSVSRGEGGLLIPMVALFVGSVVGIGQMVRHWERT